MTQLDLLPLARSSDPITSFLAADRVKEFRTAQHQQIMLALLTLGKGGAEQIGDLIDLDGYQVRKRLSELEDSFMAHPLMVEGTNVPQTRLTVYGRHERIWVAL